MLGESYGALGEADRSLERYRERLGIVTLHEDDRFDTMLRMAGVLREADRFDEAYDLLYQTRSEITAKKDSVRIAYEIGRTLEREKRYDEAVRLYYESLASAPPGDESGRLAFALGELQLYEFNRKDSASTAFSKVGVLAQDADLKKEAIRISTALSEYLSLQARYRTTEVDTAEVEFLLGENAYFHFGEAQTAYDHYDRVSTYHPESDYAPLAKAAKAYLIEEEGIGYEDPRTAPRGDHSATIPAAGSRRNCSTVGTIEVTEDSLTDVDRALGRGARHPRREGSKKQRVRQFGRTRVFPGEGEVDVPDTTDRFFAGPAGAAANHPACGGGRFRAT